jgi:hypothetical protein
VLGGLCWVRTGRKLPDNDHDNENDHRADDVTVISKRRLSAESGSCSPASTERNAVTTTTITTPTTGAPITAADRCDRCGARAAVRVLLPGGGDLVFCGHHARAYDAKLREVAVKIIGD